jgi:hypothetical protein
MHYIHIIASETHHSNLLTTKVAVEWLAPLLHIRKVPISNLGSEASYPESFPGFIQSIQINSGIVP